MRGELQEIRHSGTTVLIYDEKDFTCNNIHQRDQQKPQPYVELFPSSNHLEARGNLIISSLLGLNALFLPLFLDYEGIQTILCAVLTALADIETTDKKITDEPRFRIPL